MSTKNISITLEAYKRLAALKKENESFSQVIIRETKKARLRDIYGILNGRRGEEFEKNILEDKKRQQKIDEERHKKLLREFE